MEKEIDSPRNQLEERTIRGSEYKEPSKYCYYNKSNKLSN